MDTLANPKDIMLSLTYEQVQTIRHSNQTIKTASLMLADMQDEPYDPEYAAHILEVIHNHTLKINKIIKC